MPRTVLSGLLAAIFYTSSVMAEGPAPAQSVYDAIVQGKSVSQLRLRYEYVDQDNKADDANAFTLQTLLGWQRCPA